MKKIRRLLTAVVLIVAAGATILYVHQTMPAWYARLWYPLDHAGAIRASSQTYDLDPALVAAVIFQESSYEDDNTSHAGAIGLMQLMPVTAHWIAANKSVEIEDGQLKDPDTNIEYGCWYLRYLLDRFQDQRIALAAYNAGAENVTAWLAEARAGGHEFDYTQDVAYRETRQYISGVERSEEIYRRAYASELEGT